MKILAFFLLCLSSFVHAETVSFHLDHVPVIELANLIYADVSKANYAIDSSVLDLKDTVTVHFSDLEAKQAVGVLETLLKSSGVDIDKTGKVVFLRAIREREKAEEKDDEIFFYRPQYRSVAYITDLCGSLFKTGRFGNQRKVSSPIQESIPHSSPAGGAQLAAHPVPQKPVDVGNSAYSQINKEPDAFFFSGSVADVEKLKKLLVQIDVATPQVFVKGMVYEVTTGQKEGSAFGLAVNLLQGKFGLAIGKTASIGDSCHGSPHRSQSMIA